MTYNLFSGDVKPYSINQSVSHGSYSYVIVIRIYHTAKAVSFVC